MDINDRVKKIRIDLNMKQGEVAKRLGIRQSSLSDIENHRVNVSERVIKDFCREFNVSEEWLRTGEGQMFETLSSTANELMELAGEIAFDKDNPVIAEAVLGLIKFMKSLTPEQWEFIKPNIIQIINPNKEDNK